jgi:pilus assembly protein CpaF
MAGVGLPLAAIREQVADAIDLVVCQARGADGVRRVVEVAEVVRAAGGPGLREVFALRGGRERRSAPLNAPDERAAPAGGGDAALGAGRVKAPGGPAFLPPRAPGPP